MDNLNIKGNEAIKNDSLKNKEKISILFVCLGNICRSPAAEGLMEAVVVAHDDQRNWHHAVDG